MATIAKNDRVISRLSAKEARQTYSIKGASGLHLVVHPPGKKHPSGRKVFYSVYQLGSGKTRKRVWIEIGEYSDHPDGWTLDKATDRNKDLQAKASTGIDPRAPTTFGELFTAWLDEHAKKQLRTWADEERRYNYQLRKALGKKDCDPCDAPQQGCPAPPLDCSCTDTAIALPPGSVQAKPVGEQPLQLPRFASRTSTKQ